MIAEKEYVVCVHFILMEKHMVLIERVTTCQLHMRKFKDGDTIFIEPFRANAFPVKDLVVDRSAFDRIQQSGGYISVNTSGNTQDANSIPIPKDDADIAFDAATCIGCGACVALVKIHQQCFLFLLKFLNFTITPRSGRGKRKSYKYG